ncbi:MAG: hypothetical protein NT015_04145 [Alphaproteobacteria bacterium]|nr:hypothetical protein [Alphaproteobacteria bacterium]
MRLHQTAIAASLVALVLVQPALAQTALAPWFDADGFYNRPGIDLARATNDMTACRVEASRLKVVRNTNTHVSGGAAFTSTGAYDPVVAGAAVGIASIMFAIQDARYNGSIEQIEFRDCAVALGYRHYRMGESDRARFSAEADHGFASLVAASTPADGRLNTGEVERNYYNAELAESAYQNPAPRPPVERAAPPTAEEMAAAVAANPALNGELGLGMEPTPIVIMPGAVARLAPGEMATRQPGSAIVVVGASQRTGAMQGPWAGDTFRFRRVTETGDFIGLLQQTVTFSANSFFNPNRRRDPTLAGDFADSRYSTFVIPAGRYVLSNMGPLNACLSTVTFEVREGDVAYLGDYVLRPQGIPTGVLFNPLANINSGMDNRMRADLRVAIADNFEAARTALQADDATKTRLTRVSYQNGYRIPCDGQYIGRVANSGWSEFSATQPSAVNDAMAERVAAAAAQPQ